ncbi:MAG TPA: DUF4129 domain-containing protein [Mycobacteriales bacterium]|nr:DUF4129 domain-containing protein [Mycobacteriales bacterium]
MLRLLAQAAEAITREGARDAARDELAKPEYQVGKPSLLDRVLNRVVEELGELLADVVRIVPGGVGGVAIAIVAVVLTVVLLRLGLGPLQLRDVLTDRRRGARSRTAEDYRREAAALAAAGAWRHAIRARFRAVARELELRGVLDPRPGRTAGEIARETSAVVPAVAVAVSDAARIFDAAWYGDRPATAEQYDLISQADASINRERLAVTS